MCGRYARIRSLVDFIAPLGTDAPPGLFDDLAQRDPGPRYNIAPGTEGWIAKLAEDALTIGPCKWSFPTPRGNRINVRSETAHRVPEYRRHFDRARCVVLADGFYEPKGDKTIKNRPWYFFRPEDNAPLFLGAIVGPDGFSILTRAPVEPIASIHDRSPVMVAPEDVLGWLDPDIAGRDALREFAPTAHTEALAFWRVGDGAKKAGNEGPELIALAGRR